MTYEISKYILLKNEDNVFKQFFELLLKEIKIKIEDYKKNINIKNFNILQNYIVFFMIVTINLKSNKDYILYCFGTNFFYNTVKAINTLNEKKKILLNILNNLFLHEFTEIFFRNERDENLENLYIIENTEFSQNSLDIDSRYSTSEYKNIFKHLSTFSISYDNYFDNVEIIDDDERSYYKLLISQSIIRLTFSKEKRKYVDNIKNYEFELLKTLVEKDMKETLKKFKDNYKTLFRKEDICDDIFKYMFFIFGNSMVIESYVKPLTKIIDYEKEMERNITIDEFKIIIEEFIINLTQTIPLVLRILLKLVYLGVKKYFTIDEGNYGPLYTLLFFNFLISPRVQMIYNINPVKCNFVKTLNKLIYAIIYNSKLKDNGFEEYNDIIEIYHNKFQNFIFENIINLNENDEKLQESLCDLFSEKYLIYPEFLIFKDTEFLCSSIHGGKKVVMDYKTISIK